MGQFITDLNAEITALVPDIASVAIAGLALFALMFGIRAGIRALRSVAK